MVLEIKFLEIFFIIILGENFSILGIKIKEREV